MVSGGDTLTFALASSFEEEPPQQRDAGNLGPRKLSD